MKKQHIALHVKKHFKFFYFGCHGFASKTSQRPTKDVAMCIGLWFSIYREKKRTKLVKNSSM